MTLTIVNRKRPHPLYPLLPPFDRLRTGSAGEGDNDVHFTYVKNLAFPLHSIIR